MAHEKGKGKSIASKELREYWLSEEGLLLIEGWARDGLIDEQIFTNMGIKKTTYYNWKNAYPEFKEALLKGKMVVDRQVENALFKAALGYEFEEVTTFIEIVDGKQKKKVKKVIKHIPPNTTAQIFWLKNRKRKVWTNEENRSIT